MIKINESLVDYTVDISDKSRYDYYKFMGKHFAYDKKNNLVLWLCDEDDGTFTEIDAIGLRPENWKNKAVRDEYLAEYVDEISAMAQSYADDFIKYELPYYQDNIRESLHKTKESTLVRDTMRKYDKQVKSYRNNINNAKMKKVTKADIKRMIDYGKAESLDDMSESEIEDFRHNNYLDKIFYAMDINGNSVGAVYVDEYGNTYATTKYWIVNLLGW